VSAGWLDWVGRWRILCAMRFIAPVALIVTMAMAMAPASPASAQTLADVVGGCLGNPPLRTIPANPSNYRALLSTLQPGDRLLLAAGTYTQGLPFQNVHGTPGNCIAVEGPESGARAVFTARSCCNTISLRDSSYLALRHLDVDGSAAPEVDGVKAEGDASFAHHITLDDLVIHDHDADQQIVGISTKCPAWNWVIRRTVVRGAGTGVYLGNSDGSAEFVNGLVEHNLIHDTIGYNMQIKHQNARPSTGLGAPASGTTIVRHNVFSKASGGSTGDDARPNLLVGHWPLTGPGATDTYQVYGNLFYQNPTEALFQGSGNVAFYANLLVNDGGDAANFQFHEGGGVRLLEAFHNTIVAGGVGLRVTGLDAGAFSRRARANASFAATPFSLAAGVTGTDNVADTEAAAAVYVGNPAAPLGGGLSLFPRAGQLSGAAADLSGLSAFLDWDRDFNGLPYAATFRGAYSGQGVNPGWIPALERKPEPALPPAGPTRFHPVAPCRAVDTRGAAGPYGGPALGAASSRTFVLHGRCGIPATAVAVAANLTVVLPSAAGNLRLYPGGTAAPVASAINYRAGQARANSVLARLGTAGDLAVRCDQPSGSAHVVLDVTGYFAP
jgi:hypothetical protein